MKSFDPEKTEMMNVGNMVSLTSFNKAKFNSNKHASRASEASRASNFAETELLVNHFEKQSENA